MSGKWGLNMLIMAYQQGLNMLIMAYHQALNWSDKTIWGLSKDDAKFEAIRRAPPIQR